MFNVGDRISWNGDEGVVTTSNKTHFNARFSGGVVIEFLQSNKRYAAGEVGVGTPATLLTKAKVKKQLKLYRWEKTGTTSTGRPFVKQTEGLYDEEHAAKVLQGYVKMEGTERTIEVD